MEGTNEWGYLEPRARLELATCRLRNDPTLRMLLCSIGALKCFWCVSERFGKQLCSSLCSK